MNFLAVEGDVWDSTPTQDQFIQKYFATKESSNEVVSKRERKRKKKLASNVASTSIHSGNKFEPKNSIKKPMQSTKKLHLAEKVSSKDSLFDNNVSFKRKKLNICKNTQNNNVPSLSKDGKTNINSYVSSKDKNPDLQCKQLKKKRKLSANEVSQILNAEKDITLVQNFTVSPESRDTDDELPLREFQSKNKNKLKTKKISEPNQFSESEHEELSKVFQKPKKKKEKPNELIQIKNKSPLNETKVKRNKLKGAKSLSNAKEFLQNDKLSLNEAKEKTKMLKCAKNILNEKESFNSDSENSEEDNNIRNELRNTRMFLKIQKLMKMAPHLNPSYCEDSEENVELSSWDEISSEYSSSQSEDKCSSGDDIEALPENDEEKSVDVSEDSSDNDEEDSPDSEESSDIDEEDSPYSEELSDKEGKNSRSNQTTRKQVVQTPDIEILIPTTKKPTTFMEKARSKLAGAKFRFLNEKLYTETGEEAFRYFQDNREEFEDYHLGYRQQVSKWPLNPVDEIIKDLQKLKKNAVIADLGCGEAKIARVLNNRTVHSFDLVAKHKCVTACDFSKVPLKDSSVDVAVFCLSLMGVNLVDYLREAYRILKIGGTLKIAEVESRIEDLDIFIENLKILGFVLERQNLKNKLFVFLDLKKEKKKKTSKSATITLRPCMYKKR